VSDRLPPGGIVGTEVAKLPRDHSMMPIYIAFGVVAMTSASPLLGWKAIPIGVVSLVHAVVRGL
jgi:hypothetical protein